MLTAAYRRLMHLPAALTMILAGVPASAAVVPKNASSPEPARLNVLFIVADDLNTRLHCYGWDQVQTPNLDRLAASGMRFDRCYCQYPLCNPSRSSFLTGLRPETIGILGGTPQLRQRLPNVITLPQAFKSQGYWTAAVNKVFHERENDCDRSWDECKRLIDKSNPILTATRKRFEAEHGPVTASNRALWDETVASAVRSLGGQTPPAYGPTDMSDGEQGDGKSASQVVAWLEERAHASKPFFIGWGLQRPHIPHWAPKKYFNLYPPDALRLTVQPPDDLDDVPPAAINPRRSLYGNPTATEETRRRVTAAYYACVTFIDAQVGIVLDALNRLGLADNTIVVFTGDHGYLLGEHGLWEKAMLFEPADRIPFLLRVPGMTRTGSTCSRLVEYVDLYPTLAELCRLKTPENLEGLSCVPLLIQPDRPWKRAAFTVQKDKMMGRSVRTERWRYTEWGDKPETELYDEEKDPGEFTNLASNPAHADQVNELHTLLRAGWRGALPAGVTTKP